MLRYAYGTGKEHEVRNTTRETRHEGARDTTRHGTTRSERWHEESHYGEWTSLWTRGTLRAVTLGAIAQVIKITVLPLILLEIGTSFWPKHSNYSFYCPCYCIFYLVFVLLLDSVIMPSLNASAALDFLEESFDVILVLTSDRTASPLQLHSHSKNTHNNNNNNNTPSVCRWNVSGIDVWVEANKYDQAVFAALKGVDYEGFGRMDLLGPLKSANRLDIQETAVPSIYPWILRGTLSSRTFIHSLLLWSCRHKKRVIFRMH